MLGKYRPNVAVIVTDGQGRVLLCVRNNDTMFPIQTVQGGVDDGETTRAAAAREMGEELGLLPEQFTIVAEMPEKYAYDFPPEVRAKRPWSDFVGQEQTFFLAIVDPAVRCILDGDDEQEFAEVYWGKPEELAQQIWEPKRVGTIAALRYFGLLSEMSPLREEHQ